MLRLVVFLCWLSVSAWGQPVSQRFYQQHQQALQWQFGRVATMAELQFLLGHILDKHHTDVEPNEYGGGQTAPLSVLLAGRRGQGTAAELASAVVYPLLRYVLPQATPPPALLPNAPAGRRAATAAYTYLGVRYGAPTFHPRTQPLGTLDCSGLVNRVLTDVGLAYQRGAGSGATEGLVNSPSFQTVPGPPQPGDLLARQHGGRWRHVGVYVGNGYLIEAPYRGTVVRRVAYRPEKWLRILRHSGADQ